ncbi:hypothetical protein [Terriglobus albidus]|uniref:hypothetical protein n=1 Tax=Terriglobus albidus TaxID=1592106 RepID=UPI0021DF91FA|nr:hypothetical protein [Terriglobus albidus]
MTQVEFNEQWSVDELPACDTGMELLKHFADMHPEFTASYIRRLAWADEVDTFTAADPLWTAYVRHVSDCPHCNDL